MNNFKTLAKNIESYSADARDTWAFFQVRFEQSIGLNLIFLSLLYCWLIFVDICILGAVSML